MPPRGVVFLGAMYSVRVWWSFGACEGVGVGGGGNYQLTINNASGGILGCDGLKGVVFLGAMYSVRVWWSFCEGAVVICECEGVGGGGWRARGMVWVESIVVCQYQSDLIINKEVMAF
ncbi:hypothetical protein DPMN_058404 [Dreissena polymorpha]|uniref:Uncharacterized protein n=1 Tax=Dreissena polymorpha TaxID=45954 RepID=A0A9D4C1P5_DREPO|nr:hypothetical protein DPMN_058404 [Dreissena polymorpha]